MNIAGEVQVSGTAGQTEGARMNALLDNFLGDTGDMQASAQQQVAAAGGVPVEMQMSPAPEAETTPPVVRQAAAVNLTETAEVGDEFDMPEDILPEEHRGAQQPAQQQAQPYQQAQQPEAESSQADDIMPDEVRRSPKRAQDAWTAAKREAKQYKKELEELRKQAVTQQNNEEIETLKQQLKEAEDRIGQVDIASSSTFKRQYEAPINDMYRESVQELIKAGHDSEEAQQRVRALINPNTTQEMMAEQLSDLPSLLQGVLYTQAQKMKELQNRRSQAIQEWRNTRAAMQEEEQRQSEAVHQQVLVQNVDSAIDNLRQEGSFLFTRSNTDDNWNKAVETRIEAARGILTGPPDVLAKYVADGVAAKTYRQLYLKERLNAVKLKRDLDNVMQGRPIIGRDSALTGGPVPAADRKPRNADSWLDTNL